MKLVGYTIADWTDRYCFLSRWRGYEAEIQTQVERCIRRYCYSGSFLRYLFRTLEYAGRGIRPLQAYSLDERGHLIATQAELTLSVIIWQPTNCRCGVAQIFSDAAELRAIVSVVETSSFYGRTDNLFIRIAPFELIPQATGPQICM